METTAFYLLLFFHLSFLVLGFGSVLVTDLYGLLWVRNRVRFTQIISVSSVTKNFIWAGWIGMVAAGIPLILIKGEVDNLMIIKLFFVIVVGINGILLHLIHKKVENYQKGAHVPNLFMFRLILALTVSQIGWWSALIIGFLHRHVYNVIDWPNSPWLVSGAILGGLLSIWGAGELFFKKKTSQDLTV